jgi:hypothetical protein
MISTQYKKIIPENLKNIYSLEENYYLRDQFSEEQYNKISRLSYNQLKKWNKKINFNLDIENTDFFNIFKINFNNTEEDITSCNCIEGENSYPFHLTILNDSLLCNFISQESILNKIFSTDNRYSSFLIDLVTETKNAGHNCLFVIDKIKTECYIIDSNGSLDYFDNIIDGYQTSYFLHKAFENYANTIGFKYVNLLERKINLKINIKINSNKQSKFFKGYCKGWSLYFQYLLFKCDDNFEIIDYISTLNSYKNLGPVNELIEIFQVWFYNNVF